MNKTITLSELESNLSAVFDDVTQEHGIYLVTDSDQPKAVIVEYSVYLRLTSPSTTQAKPLVGEAPASYTVEENALPAERLESPWSQTDEDWFNDHYLEIAERFPRKWVAVQSGAVIAWYNSAKKNWIKLDPANSINPEKCFRDFVGWKYHL